MHAHRPEIAVVVRQFGAMLDAACSNNPMQPAQSVSMLPTGSQRDPKGRQE
jgi:hypothetical protein